MFSKKELKVIKLELIINNEINSGIKTKINGVSINKLVNKIERILCSLKV